MIDHSDPTTQEVTETVARDFRTRFNTNMEPPNDHPYTLPELFITHQTDPDTGAHTTRRVPVPHEEMTGMGDFKETLHACGHFAHDHLGTRLHSCTILLEGRGGKPEDLPFDTKEEVMRALREGVTEDIGDPCFAFLTAPVYEGGDGTCVLPITQRNGYAWAKEPTRKDMMTDALRQFTDIFWSGFECSSVAVN
jgi:hypothetical protein